MTLYRECLDVEVRGGIARYCPHPQHLNSGAVPVVGLEDTIDTAVVEGIHAARARQPGVMPSGSVLRDEIVAAVVAVLTGEDNE